MAAGLDDCSSEIEIAFRSSFSASRALTRLTLRMGSFRRASQMKESGFVVVEYFPAGDMISAKRISKAKDLPAYGETKRSYKGKH